jgi:hypothetical protein
MPRTEKLRRSSQCTATGCPMADRPQSRTLYAPSRRVGVQSRHALTRTGVEFHRERGPPRAPASRRLRCTGCATRVPVARSKTRRRSRLAAFTARRAWLESGSSLLFPGTVLKDVLVPVHVLPHMPDGHARPVVKMSGIDAPSLLPEHVRAAMTGTRVVRPIPRQRVSAVETKEWCAGEKTEQKHPHDHPPLLS